MLIKRLLRSRYILTLIAFAAGCAVLAIPLVGTLHVDSALLAGVIGAFTGSLTASRRGARDRDVLLLMGLLYVAAVPLLIRDLMTGCFSGDGVAFWLFIPSFSTLFGYAFGRAVRYLIPIYTRWIAFFGILAVAAGGWLIIFLLFPQLYYFNHIFGYWPGPIYDESVSFTGRLLHFRIITVIWIGIFWMIPYIREGSRIIKSIFLLLIMLLGISYTQATQNGIYSPASHIRGELEGVYQTDHFDIYFSRSHFDVEEIAFIGELHEYHFTELTDTLRIAWPEGKRIESYLYGHAWQMQELTGAKGVSFVPVWLRTAQLHMQKTALDRTLRHELVHVIARTFGNRLLNASWNIGLVEGLAVALSSSSSARLTVDQLVVSNDAWLTEGEIRRLFSMFGFYRRSSSVAYGVSGSFVRSLLLNYPVDNFKTAYRYSSLERGYGELLVSAVDRWHDEIALVHVTDEERATAERIFSIPSIFDTKCPRKITKQQACLDAAARDEAVNDTLAFFGHPGRDQLREWIWEIVEEPIDRERFEEYRNAVYLLAFDLSRELNLFDYPESKIEKAGTGEVGTDSLAFEETRSVESGAFHLVRQLANMEWRPIRQMQLEEAHRFLLFCKRKETSTR